MVKVEFTDGTEEILNMDSWRYIGDDGLFLVCGKRESDVFYPREVVKSIRYVEGENE